MIWSRNVSVKNPEVFRENVSLIFGDPRSGSTWLAELLNQLPGTLIIDEPLNLKKAKILANGGFGWRQHIPVDVKWELPKNYFEDLFNGQKIPKNLILSPNFSLKNVSTPIIKIIRGKLLADWLLANCQITRKPIFLVRHPMAVIASMIHHPSWDYPFKNFQLPESPHIDLYEKHLEFLISLKTKEELLLSHWCMANEALKSKDTLRQKFHLVHYEYLLMQPSILLEKILNDWGIKHRLKDFDLPSSTRLEQSKISKNDQLSKWKKQLSIDQQQQLQDVLDYFEVIEYSRENLLPGT